MKIGRMVAIAIVGLMVVTGFAGCLGGQEQQTGEYESELFQSRETSFDENWWFYRGDATGAEATSFDDSSWRMLDLPHDAQIEDLPYATSDDGAATSNPSAFTFLTNPSLDGTAPEVIGPFDANGNGGRNLGYTVGITGWYRKHFTLPDLGADQRVEVRFDGIYIYSEFWLNGNYIGMNPNSYLPAILDLTPYLNRDGDNVIAVRFNNSAGSSNSRWYTGSGIYRHTWLTITGPVRIPTFGVYATTPTVGEDLSVAHVETTVANLGSQSSTAKVGVRIFDPQGNSVASSTTDGQSIEPGKNATFAVDCSIESAMLWDLDNPNLYTAKSEVLINGKVVDSTTTTFGIRSLVFNGDVGFLLNGKTIKINGANVHHDFGALGAVCLERSEERKIEIFKAAGFNAIRTSHNPHSPGLMEACDKLGMLVWDELCDAWTSGAVVPTGVGSDVPTFATWWQHDLTNMIMRDRNHPSVVIWSIGNEEGSDENDYGPKLADLVRTLDKTRPVSLGGMNLVSGGTDPFSYLDIADYHAFPTADDHAAHPNLPMTQSEDVTFSIYDDWKIAQENPWYVGSWVWVGWDYIGESGAGAPIPMPVGTGLVVDSVPNIGSMVPVKDLGLGMVGSIAGAPPRFLIGLPSVLGAIPYPWFNDFQGDIDLIGQPRPQNFYRNVVWGSSPMEMVVLRPLPPLLMQYPGGYEWYDALESWTWEDVTEGTNMVVHVYTSGDQVNLLLNGEQVGTKAMAESDEMIAEFSVPYTPGQLTAIAYKAGMEIGRKTFITTGAPAGIRLTSDVESLTTSRDDLSHVLVEIVDSEGRLVPDAVVRVSFDISGTGTLAGVANGNPHNVDSFQQPRRYTWHGQCLAILRPAKTAGEVTMIAEAPGLESATLTLPVTEYVDADTGKASEKSNFIPGFEVFGLISGLAASFSLIRRRK